MIWGGRERTDFFQGFLHVADIWTSVLNECEALESIGLRAKPFLPLTCLSEYLNLLIKVQSVGSQMSDFIYFEQWRLTVLIEVVWNSSAKQNAFHGSEWWWTLMFEKL